MYIMPLVAGGRVIEQYSHGQGAARERTDDGFVRSRTWRDGHLASGGVLRVARLNVKQLITPGACGGTNFLSSRIRFLVARPKIYYTVFRYGCTTHAKAMVSSRSHARDQPRKRYLPSPRYLFDQAAWSKGGYGSTRHHICLRSRRSVLTTVAAR